MDNAVYCEKLRRLYYEKTDPPPPPPPPPTHLSKDSRFKYLFKTSNSHSAIHQCLPWKWNTLFPLGPKANLFLTARPKSETTSIRSLYTQKAGRGRSLCLLTPILIILALISSCSSGTETKSSQARITELTVTINGSDYSITFDTDRAFTVSIPASETIPGKITVKSAVISEKASGLQASDELTVTSNQASITITAEDGTTISYTLSLNILPAKITATEIPKRADTDVRDSYVLFSIEANKDLSNYHLAVKEKGKTAPTAAEMTAGALKRNLSANPINVLIAQRLNAPIISYAKDTDSGKTLGTGMTNNDGIILDSAKDATDTWIAASGTDAWVAESVLKPSTQYTLYGMENNGTAVKELLDFSTDATAVTSDYPAKDAATVVDTTLTGTDYDIALHADEYYIFPMQTQFNSVSGDDIGLMTVRIEQLDILPILVGSRGMFSGTVASGMLFLVKNIDGASSGEMFQKGSYLLLNTSIDYDFLSGKQNVFWEECHIRVSTGTSYDAPHFQKLIIQ